jgi:FMN phosphatase YigB (HAD superfamily)
MGAREFLSRVRALGKRLVLVTNSHPTTLAIKDARTQVISHFDAGFSSHIFGAPKEDLRFWLELAKLERFNPARCVAAFKSDAALGETCQCRGVRRRDERWSVHRHAA